MFLEVISVLVFALVSTMNVSLVSFAVAEGVMIALAHVITYVHIMFFEPPTTNKTSTSGSGEVLEVNVRGTSSAEYPLKVS